MPTISLTDHEYSTLKTVLAKTMVRSGANYKNLEKQIKNIKRGRVDFSAKDMETISDALNLWHKGRNLPDTVETIVLLFEDWWENGSSDDPFDMSKEEQAEEFTDWVNTVGRKAHTLR